MRKTIGLLVLLFFIKQIVTHTVQCDDKNSLFDKKWLLIKIQGVEAPQGSSLVFEPLKVTGSTGCNTFWAPIEYKRDSEIDIGPPQSARLYCYRAMALERAYLAALESIKSFKLEGNKLKMMMEDGDVFLEFETASKR
ncbi:MAG: META domain-containing protein [Hyphomicrobium sp.]